MEKDKLQSEPSDIKGPEVHSMDASAEKSLQRRNWALIAAVVAGVIFGGSCESKLSCVGKETVGCSCRDTDSRIAKKNAEKKKRLLEY